MPTETERYVLGLSPDGESFYALYNVDSAGELRLVANLSTLYPRALVKAYFLAAGGGIANSVPFERRVLRGDCTTRSGNKRKAPGWQVMPFGKFANACIKDLAEYEPNYCQWFFFNVDPKYAGSDRWREPVVDAMATILFYMPGLVADTFLGPIYTALSLKKPRKQVTKRQPRKKKPVPEQPTLPGMEDLSPLRLADPDMNEKIRRALGTE